MIEEKTPTEWKNLGNEDFKNKKYQEAVQKYSNAIDLDDSQSVFYSNRARCYKHLGEIEKAYKDANNAIELDMQNIKAHLLTGQLLAEMGKLNIKDISAIELSIKRMTKALTLCAGQQKKQFEGDLECYIKRSRKLLWYKKREQKLLRLREIQNQLFQIIDKQYQNSNDEEIQRKKELDTIGDPDEKYKFDIPDYFCCQITLNFLSDPVTTSSGFTYEKEILNEHFQRNGYFDPVSRKPVQKNEVVPNINIKQAVEEFLKENPWAYEYKMGETIEDIEF